MKCRKCGKNFDYEKYYGICPKCGSYNREDEEEQAQQDLFLRDGRDPFQSSFGGAEEQGAASRSSWEGSTFAGSGDSKDFSWKAGESASSDSQGGRDSSGGWEESASQEKKKPRRKTGCLFFLICIVICFLCILAVFGAEMFYGMKQEENAALQEFAVVEAETGEKVEIGSHEVTVTGVQVLEEADMRPEFPAGERCIAVSFAVETPEYDSGAYMDAPYLAYESGGCRIYKNAISEYDFEVYEDYYGVHLMDSYDWNYEEAAEGVFVFFLEPDAQDVRVCVEERSGRYEDEKLEGIFEIDLEIPEGGI